MSKKKRKTRAEKSIPKKHNFDIPVYKVTEQKTKEVGDKKLAAKKEEIIDPRILIDLKKVAMIIGFMVFLLILVSVLAYKTEVLNPLLQRFNISY